MRVQIHGLDAAAQAHGLAATSGVGLLHMGLAPCALGIVGRNDGSTDTAAGVTAEISATSPFRITVRA